MNFLKKILNLNNAKGTIESMKDSYDKHFLAAQKGEIPIPNGMTPHIAGLYGALSTRYIVAKISRLETVLWAVLTPFILMSKKESVEALAEYIVCVEDPKDRQREKWLKELINTTLRSIDTVNEDYIAMASAATLQSDIYWLGLLDPDVSKILNRQQEKILANTDITEED